ncbi:MAG: electron transfer flavoprotein subunit alpha/FixB family protein [Syntrophomonadaceae bacterium]|nr:electron transfer flavoprotein subunit alpha/FixB family protein [Syntrophomonadaceae bacterium]
MAAILVFSERDEVAFQLLGEANKLGEQLGMEVAAAALGLSDADGFLSRGVSTVYTAKNEELKDFEASVYAQALEQVAKQADAAIILLGSTRRGKELAGRLAQKMKVGSLTDAGRLEVIDGRVVCSRNAFGGATVAAQTILEGIQVIAVSPSAGEAPAAAEPSGSVAEVALVLEPARIKKVATAPKSQDSANIEGAEVLVCVGKGLAGEAELKMVDELAQALGGLVACTKPLATDEKWLPEERIVGLSGKIGKPALAICLGISGQVQFTVGIRDAGTIVAVNTDQNAFIFQMADYGIVGDLHQVVPELTAALKG